MMFEVEIQGTTMVMTGSQQNGLKSWEEVGTWVGLHIQHSIGISIMYYLGVLEVWPRMRQTRMCVTMGLILKKSHRATWSFNS